MDDSVGNGNLPYTSKSEFLSDILHRLLSPTLAPYDPKNVTVLAGANADDQGRYVVAVFGGCYPDETYGLRLYADSLAPYPLDVGHDQDQLEVPRNCEYLLGQPVKDCKTDIVGQLKAP